MTEINQLFGVSDKVAIVTGASRGLGKATAVGLGKVGADVTVADILTVAETVREINAVGSESFGIKVDVRKKNEVEEMVKKTIDEFGKIDILVNNAGINLIRPTEEMSEKDWNKVFEVNLKGQFLCAQATGKRMIEQKSGKIINISSINAEFAFPNCAAYNASKAGVIMLTKTLAYEWGKHNINVNAICPGFMKTPMLEEIHKGMEAEEKDLPAERLKKIPLEKFANPTDLIGSIIFLSSSASDYVTGHALYVDGGWTIGWPGVERASLDPELEQALED